MHIFIDHNLPPILAKVVHPFVEDEYGGKCISLRDKFQVSVADEVWIGTLEEERKTSGINWCFFTGDLKLRTSKAEKEALKATGIAGFFFRKSFQSQDMNQQLSKIFKLIPDMQKQTKECHKKGTTKHFEIPAQANRLEQL